MIDEDYFKVGEIVTFEIDKTPNKYPVWNFAKLIDDHTGVYTTATIVDVTPEYIRTIQDPNLDWNWPNVYHPDYHPDQWKREGYLQKIEEPLKEKTKTCTCDLLVLMNRGCQCGGR